MSVPLLIGTNAEEGNLYLVPQGTLDTTGGAFDLALDGVQRTYHGRASNLYGLLDNNDAFDYLGGLSLAIEGRTGRVPEALILQHAEPEAEVARSQGANLVPE